MEAVLRFTNRIFTGHAKPQLHILIRYIVKNVYACVDMQQRIACPLSPSVYTRNFGKTCLAQLLLTPEFCTFQLKFMSYTMQRCFQIPPFPPRFFLISRQNRKEITKYMLTARQSRLDWTTGRLHAITPPYSHPYQAKWSPSVLPLSKVHLLPRTCTCSRITLAFVCVYHMQRVRVVSAYEYSYSQV